GVELASSSALRQACSRQVHMTWPVATASSDSGSDVSSMLGSSRADSSAINGRVTELRSTLILVKLAFSELPSGPVRPAASIASARSWLMCALRPRKKLPAAETRPSRAALNAIFQARGTSDELL